LGLKCLLLAFALLAAPRVFATGQMPDKLLYNGKEYDISINPLEPYLIKNPRQRERLTDSDNEIINQPLSREELHALLKNTKIYSNAVGDDEKLDKLAVLFGKRLTTNRGVMSTALTRRYIATFEIKDSQLFVKDIVVMDGESESGYRSVFKKLFSGETAIKADWVTGLLMTTGRRDIQDGKGVYSTLIENRLVFEFQEGNLISERSMNDNEYTDFVQTDAYKAIREKMKGAGYKNIHYWSDPDNWDDRLTIWTINRKDEKAETSNDE